MSAYKRSIALNEMKNAAQSRFEQADERLSGIESRIDSRLGGKTRVSMFFGILVTLAWGVGLYYFAMFLKKNLWELIPNIGIPFKVFQPAVMVCLGLTALMLVLMVLSGFLQMKYYGSILSARDQVSRLRSRISVGKTSLTTNLSAYEKCAGQNWKQALTAGDSIPEATDEVERKLAGMDSLHDGFLAKLQNFLYHAVCIGWCILGCVGEYNICYSLVNDLLFDGDLGWNLAKIVMIIFTVITVVVEIIVARAIWSGTGCRVKNLTVLGILPGPAMFVLLIGVVAVIIALVIIAIQIVLGLGALLLGGAFVFGMTSGG